MISKIHFFPEKLAKFINEHGERFHKNILAKEKRCLSKWTSSMLVDYCWTLKWDVPEANYW